MVRTNDKNNAHNRMNALATNTRLSVLLAVLLGGVSASLGSEAREDEFTLSVRPSICVSYNSDEPCQMSMEVSWEGSSPADVCLRDGVSAPMLRCWENSRAGTLAVDYANTIDVLYQLVEEADQGVLAEAEVKVINRDLRDSRKRRRHVWSIL